MSCRKLNNLNNRKIYKPSLLNVPNVFAAKNLAKRCKNSGESVKSGEIINSPLIFANLTNSLHEFYQMSSPQKKNLQQRYKKGSE